MDKRGGLGDLIGRTIGEKYRLDTLIRETSKSLVFKATEVGELSPHRKVALKILKPYQGPERENQFRTEVDRLAQVGEHPNLTTLYGSGRDGKFFYVAMEYIPGSDLAQEIEKGMRFSLEEILDIVIDITEVASHLSNIGGHQDIKLKNIKVREETVERGETEKTYVVDLGGRLRTVKASNDIYGIGFILKELLKQRENHGQKVPRKLEKIVRASSRGRYKTITDFKSAIDRYLWWNTETKALKIGPNITRKKFFKLGASTLTLGAIGSYGLGYLRHRNSIDYIVEQISQTEAIDYDNIDPLFGELAFRILDQKIRWLVESEKIPRGKFPYAVSKDGTEWSNTDGTYWSDGFWPGILWLGLTRTKDRQFKEWATDWLSVMKFTERDNITINPIRFYYSHALGYEITKNENFLEKSLQSVDLISQRFNENGNYLQSLGELDKSDRQRIQIDNMTSLILPLSWAYKIIKDLNYHDIIVKHCNATIKFNINEDGSIIQIVEFNPNTTIPVRGIKSNGFSENSCLSRGQARAIKGFVAAYEATKEERFLETAEQCARYFIENLPQDNVPFYDFKDPNKDIPKDSSAASIASSGLLDLFSVTSKIEYKLAAKKILKSLSTRYLSKEKDYQGMLLHACSNRNKGANVDVSLIYGDYHFIESLNKV